MRRVDGGQPLSTDHDPPTQVREPVRRRVGRVLLCGPVGDHGDCPDKRDHRERDSDHGERVHAPACSRPLG
jgi:hypothetical protein